MYQVLSGVLLFVENIPAGFWGVVFGSFLSFGGVWLTNRANDQRLRLQFEHDRDLRAKERDLILRKEVYMAGAEAFHAGTLMISNLPNLDITQEKLEAIYREKAPAIAKVQLIAGDRAMRAVAIAMGTLAELLVQFMGKRIILLVVKQEIGQLEQLIVGFSKTRDQMLELMTQHNIDGSKDQQRFATLQGNFNFEQKRINEGIAKRNIMVLDMANRQFTFAEECLAASQRLHLVGADVLEAVRDELELPFDSKAYADLVKEIQEKSKEGITALLRDIREMIANSLAAQQAGEGAVPAPQKPQASP